MSAYSPLLNRASALRKEVNHLVASSQLKYVAPGAVKIIEGMALLIFDMARAIDEIDSAPARLGE